MQISSEGYDPIYGARPLKRTIQKNILDPLSRSIINEEFKNGDIIMVSIGSEGLEFNNK
jgi:ATP-dependent Clp protease ATP-binding subunit ClpB